MLKGEEKGEQEVPLLLSTSGPLQPTGAISSPNSEFSCFSAGHPGERGGVLFLVSPHNPFSTAC